MQTPGDRRCDFTENSSAQGGVPGIVKSGVFLIIPNQPLCAEVELHGGPILTLMHTEI